MKTTVLCVVLVLLWSITAFAEEVFIYRTYPGTNLQDYSQPGYILEFPTRRGEPFHMYPTYPGTALPDYSQPGYVSEPPEGSSIGNFFPGQRNSFIDSLFPEQEDDFLNSIDKLLEDWQ